MKKNKLTPAQESVLKQAAQTGTVQASQLSLNGGARKKVLQSLVNKCS